MQFNLDCSQTLLSLTSALRNLTAGTCRERLQMVQLEVKTSMSRPSMRPSSDPMESGVDRLVNWEHNGLFCSCHLSM